MADTQEARKIWQALEKPVSASIREKTQSAIRSKKMVVVSPPDDAGLVEVRDAFSASFLLPYDKGTLRADSFEAGKSVLVYWYQNDFSTAIIARHGSGTGDAPSTPDVKIFTNVQSGAFVETGSGDHPFEAVLPCPGITEDYFADVVFPADVIARGILSPVCTTSDNAVTIYAREAGEPVTALTILCIREA